MKNLILIALLALTTALYCQAAYVVENTVAHTHAKSGVTVVSGSVELPTGTDWTLKHPLQAVGGLSDVVLRPPDEFYKLRKGRRTRLIEEDRKRKQGQRTLRSLYWALRRYATEHGGMAPAALTDLNNKHYSNTVTTATFHYVPGVQLLKRKGTNSWVNASTNLLAFELKPAVDDGEHWVLHSNGSVTHKPINQALFDKYGVALTPGAKPVTEQMKSVPAALSYRLSATLRDGADDKVVLELVAAGSDRASSMEWDLRNPGEGEADTVKNWAQSRLWYFNAMDRGEGASVLTYWTAALARQYGLKMPDRQRDTGRRGRRGERQTSLFNVLGGRAAIRETLQLQAIGRNWSDTKATNWVDVSTLKGVEVKSHPFAEMLGDAKGGALALADVAPPDRLFAYFAKPKALLQMMDGGTDFIFRGGASATGRSLEYRITQRYLGKLGLSERWVRSLMNSGAVRELAVMLPDLFLVDGTDLTVVCRLSNPKVAAAALMVLGLSSLDDIVARKADDGGDAFWTQRDDLLLISTQRSELERVLALVEDPSGSLGQSDEFRYMLSRQPINANTRAYAYFSDPFVRRLVGPAVKIGQLRRLQARTEMEAIAAGQLLHRADGRGATTSIEQLVELGYVPRLQRVTDAILTEAGEVTSTLFGSLQHLSTLLDAPVTDVSNLEAKAYKSYVDRYNRFWRRFFDPIGVRFDQVSPREMALSVFILPLVDNSMYQGLRQVLIAGENVAPLPLPELDPAPVATLSFNLGEKAWLQVVESLDDMFEQMLGLGPDILDHLGPDIHIAMGDADPIIGLGSGELTGLAGIVGGGNNEMFMIPMFVSMLTRPCVLMMGLDDPEAVRAKLSSMATGSLSGRPLFFRSTGSLYKVAGRDAWHYVLSVGGLLNLRFGVEVKDRYLVISNLPLTHNPEVRSWREAPRNAAAMQLDPAACIQQLPALYTSASSRQRAAAMGGLGCLYPLLRSGSTDVSGAIERHRRLFGFAPMHPGRGEWEWDGTRLSSSIFGQPGREEQPEYDPADKEYGIFQGIGNVGLSMQFEDDGLRSHCRWVLAE